MKTPIALGWLPASLILCLYAAGASAQEPVELEVLRTAAARYADVQSAVADGYLRDPADVCVTAEMEGMPSEWGAMGIHYFRPDLLGITATEPRVAGVGTHTDWETPGVLIYEPQADGGLELVAIENVVFEAGWLAADRTAPPEFLGNEYWHMVDDPSTDLDEAHGFEPHYELHAWIPRENSLGIFHPHNPAVTCQHHMPQSGQ
jgi:hypothetical protein